MNNVTLCRKARIFSWMLPLILLSSAAVAQDARSGGSGSRILRSTDVVVLAAQKNPSLMVVITARKKAAAELQAARGLYPVVFHADGSTGRIHTPTGGSFYNESTEVGLGFGISRTFPVGTSADFSIDGLWRESHSPQAVPGGVFPANPTLGLSARLSITQPLIRGFGEEVGLQSLRQAEKSKTLAEKSLDQAASALAAEVLRLYWELWLAEKVVQINERSRDVAAAQVVETTMRAASGEVATVDILAARTRVASLEEAVIEARAEATRLGVLLAGSCGILAADGIASPDVREEVPSGGNEVLSTEILARALQQSPEIQQGFAALQYAEEKARNAGESMRQRLDLQTWIEARTLSVEDPSATFTDFGNREALSAWVGLSYELPLDNRKKEGDRAAAHFAVEMARNELAAAENRVRTEVVAAVERLSSASQRLETAQDTFSLAKAQADAERERYRLGATIFTTVREADEIVRQAELRVTRARVDIVKAEIALQYLDGTLLTQIALPE